MSKLLSDAQQAAYARDGFVCPVPVLAPREVADLRGELEAWEQARGEPIDFPEKSKSYLLFNWADQLVHHPRILDAVEDLIGPDILVYHSTLFLKEAQTPAFVRWHQDSTYFYLEPHAHVTAWVALSDASERAGCMVAVPGSHRWGAMQHDDAPAPDHVVRPGQMSLHHTDLVHSSAANTHTDRRIGYAISYIPAHVRPVGATRPSALPVRGRDHGHFLPEARLVEPLSDCAYQAHASALARFRALQDAGYQQTRGTVA